MIFTELISVKDLRAYHCGARCFSFPPTYEGFGFPPLEAMACGYQVLLAHYILGTDSKITLKLYQEVEERLGV